MIERTLLNAVQSGTQVPCYMEIPENPPAYYYKLERTGGGQRGQEQRDATFAVQSYAPTLLEAAEMNEQLLDLMRELQFTEDEIVTCQLNSTYNFTDPDAKRYRYQAVFDLVYFA